jgi:hypothetical protein
MKFRHTGGSSSVLAHLWGADINAYSSGNMPRITCAPVYRYLAGYPWELVEIRTYSSSK